ncbi:MAG TPA: protein kinase [Thermoanaerobaculia bacterium]|nr:protein kinase [Thermoanaerobaculia bacterium]
MKSSQPGEALDLPAKIASYRIEQRLGAGGMGVVYRAFDEALRRPLAIKHLLPSQRNPIASRRFRREAQAAARLNHPAIVHVYDVVETAAGDWIVMELVEGMPLSQKIREGGLDLGQAIRLGREIAEGLAEAHAQGVIHRDLKAGNVMVTASGRAKILDFGLAKLVHHEGDTDLSQPGIVLGTCHAMSPEQLQAMPVDHRSDLFSLGSLLYEMVTGVSPFLGGTPQETLGRIFHFQPPPVCALRPEVPLELSALIGRLLVKEPDRRLASAGEVVRRLAALEGVVTEGSGRGSAGAEDLGEQSTIVEGLARMAAERLGAGLRIDMAPGTSPDARPTSAPRPVNERRQVTVVYCELVGTDGLSGLPQAFDPETLHDLMRGLRALADGVARRYDGQLGNVLGGPRVLIYFGYPQAHEDNARRAVRSALELVDQAGRMKASSEPGRPIVLALRAGIHTGPAVVSVPPQDQEPITLGATLDLAVALQSRAEPGGVIVSPATCSLVGRSFSFEALPALTVPGLAAPLTPCRVLEPIESPDDSFAGLVPLVGREREMELLLSRWAQVREGNGQVILISGEAGIGKSRLVLALREKLQQSPAPWWSCFGSPYVQSSPLQPVVDLLRQVLRQRQGASPLSQLENLLQEAGLLSAVPLLAPLLDLPLDERYPAPPLTPQRQREKTLEALASWVVETAERQPLVLLIEDLHWLDPTTLEWLGQLIDQAASAPLLLLLTLRLHTVESLWGPRSHLTQITLTPLNDGEAATLIDRVVGELPLPAQVRRQIVARTDGVPLFLEELTKTVLESHSAGARQELPITLRDSLAARLDRLGAAKEVAQIAAVIGRVFTLELLAAVCACDESALQQRLQRLVQVELVYRKGFGAQARYLFKHALVQDAAYESLLKRERRQIHRQIAETLASRFPATAETTPEILAHHYTEAGLPEPAVDFWVRAGDLASRRSASAEAISHLDRALRLLQSLPESPARDRRELAIQKGRAAALMTWSYINAEVEQAFARAEVLAERLAEAEERFWAVLGLQIFNVVSGNLPQGLELSERLLRIAESEGRPNLLSIAWLSLGTYHFHHVDYAEAIPEFEKAYELAPPDDDSFRVRTGVDPRVVALSFAAICVGHLGQFDRARQMNEQSIALARQLGHPFSLGFACLHAAQYSQGQHDAASIRPLAREVYEISTELGFSRFSWICPLLLVWAELYAPTGDPPAVGLGDFDSVQQAIAENSGRGMPYFFHLHGHILLLQGRLRDAWRALDEGLRIAQAQGVASWTEYIYLLQGEILLHAESPPEIWEGDRTAEAERLFQRALEQARCNGSKALVLRSALGLGKLWQAQGRTEAARELVAQARQGFTGVLESHDLDLREARAFLDSCSTE